MGETGALLTASSMPLSGPGGRPAPRRRHRRRAAPRCPVCGLHQSLCVCAILPRIALPWRLIVVQHGVEVDRPTNTGRMALHLLTHSVRVLYGRRGVALDTAPLEDPGHRYLALFPRAEAPWLTPEDLQPEEGRTPALVVPDGTWAQASHMMRRIAPLRRMRCVRLPPGPPGLWRIRRPRHPDQLCTLEAVIRAVEIGGHASEATALFDALALIHARMQAMRAGALAATESIRLPPFAQRQGKR